jgi:hypothetical protein
MMVLKVHRWSFALFKGTNYILQISGDKNENMTLILLGCNTVFYCAFRVQNNSTERTKYLFPS